MRASVITLLLGVGLIAIIAPVPSKPVSAEAARLDDAWVVPAVTPTRGNTQVLEGLRRSALWGAIADAPAGPDAKAREWRIVGITGAALKRTVILQFGDERILPLSAGDKFPDGTLIVEVQENGVCVSMNGKKRRLLLPGQALPQIW